MELKTEEKVLSPHYKTTIGLDVHQLSISACAMTVANNGSNVTTVSHEFRTFKSDLERLAAWCKEQSAEAITMESTGIYWKSPYRVLEKHGFNVQVVNARHVKAIRGRKTDHSDSVWLAKMIMLNTIGGSFVQPADLDKLRIVSRQRQQLTGVVSGEKNRIAKIFADAGVRLGALVSDMHGVAATKMAECLINGGTPLQALRAAGKHRLKASNEDLLHSLENDLTDSHRLSLKTILIHIREVKAHIQELDDHLLAGLIDHAWAIELLQTLPGIDVMAAAMILVEIGTDMSKFGAPEKLVSWAGLCQGQNESAGKKYSGRTRKGNKWLRRILTEAAHAASKTKDCMFEQKYNALAVTRGRKRSIIAIAHKMLRIIFKMLQNNEPYKDKVVDYQEMMVKRNAPRWIKALIKYGYLDPTKQKTGMERDSKDNLAR
jgi:transposase